MWRAVSAWRKNQSEVQMYEALIKRVVDFTVAAFLCIALLPILLLVAIVIVIDSKGPAFFVQNRVGRNCRVFSLYKFRTMTDELREIPSAPVIGKATGVTNAGHFLRKYKLDELPQLINILKGDMSLVGPRPGVPMQLRDMTKNEKKRYSVPPGLTGLAQVSGNIHIRWKERFEFDLEYVKNISFLNDMRIIFRTALLIFVGEEYFVGKSLKIGKRKL